MASKEAAARGKRLLLVVGVIVILAIDDSGLGIFVVIVSDDPA